MRAVTTTLLLVSALALAGVASAQERGSAAPRAAEAAPRTVSGQVLIVLASNVAGVIDPQLANVPALRRPPFDSYGTMALLSSPTIRLRVGEPQEIELPNGRHIRLVLREVTDEGRFRVQLSINRPGQRDYLPEMNVVASPGDPFFVAGQSFQAGTLVIGVRLGERAH